MFGQISKPSLPDLKNCLDTLVFSNGTRAHPSCLSHEFRSASSLKEQIHYIQRVIPAIGVRRLCEILCISSRRYYNVIKESPRKSQNENLPPPSQLLNKKRRRSNNI